ncbi:hypothetical protein [Fluviispira vulneris]|uniref:hypothetical protein n=1 Tax=Fluviispira vulneris TaxID=2763012 RepID=UPI0016491C0D|nr:hypothetical protein [Fluviispira vulneris]
MPYSSSIGKQIYKKNLLSALNMTDKDANMLILDKQAEAFAKSIDEILPLLIVTVPSTGLNAPSSGGPVIGVATGTIK